MFRMGGPTCVKLSARSGVELDLNVITRSVVESSCGQKLCSYQTSDGEVEVLVSVADGTTPATPALLSLFQIGPRVPDIDANHFANNKTAE
jgi:hypothetical protein